VSELTKYKSVQEIIEAHSCWVDIYFAYETHMVIWLVIKRYS
jgi:hypothetical protein